MIWNSASASRWLVHQAIGSGVCREIDPGLASRDGLWPTSLAKMRGPCGRLGKLGPQQSLSGTACVLGRQPSVPSITISLPVQPSLGGTASRDPCSGMLTSSFDAGQASCSCARGAL